MVATPSFALGIRHLLLYTAALGVNLTINRVITELSVEPRGAMEQVHAVYSYATAATSAVSIAALALWITNLEARSRWFPKEPGHWLLIADGLARLLGSAALIATMILLTPENGKIYAQYYSFFTFQMATAPCYAAILTSVMQSHAMPRRWQALFCLIVGGEVLKGLWSLPLFLNSDPWDIYRLMPWQITPYLFTLATIALIAAVLSDQRMPVKRDWLHRLAIVVWLLEWVMYLVWYGVQMYG